MSDKSFNPSNYLMKLQGKDYLEVKWRLVWLRSEHPDATVAAELVEHMPKEFAVFKATVSIPGGGSATDYGSETAKDFGDYLEKASTKAVGRALGALGFGTQFCSDFDTGISQASGEPRIVDSPVARPQAPQRTQPPPQAQTPANGNGQRDYANSGGEASAKQVDFIRSLAVRAGLSIVGPSGEALADDGAIQSFVDGLSMNATWPHLTKAHASDLITALKQETALVAPF